MFQNILNMNFSPDLLHKQDCGQKRSECFAHVISVAASSIQFERFYFSRKLNRFSTEHFLAMNPIFECGGTIAFLFMRRLEGSAVFAFGFVCTRG